MRGSSICFSLTVLNAAVIIVCLTGCATPATTTTISSTSPFSGSPPAPPFTVSHKISGLGVGPFVLSGQDPNLGTVVPDNQLQYLISDAAQYASLIRTFGTSNTLQDAGTYIHQAGAKAMIGASLTNENTAANMQANTAELNRLIAMANAGQADIVTVGDETLYTGTLTPSQLLAYMAYVKANIPASVQVSTVDTWSMLVNNPSVIAACDVVLANIYPFYEDVTETNALAQLQSDYAQILKASGTKQLMIAETGWPSSGSPPSQGSVAIPSQANQLAYFLSAEQWAKQTNIAIIWFEAFSEPWKANYNDYPSWGIFDSNYVIESQFAGAFQ